MDKKLFKRLVESMGQMGEIMRGVRAPSRTFRVVTAKVQESRAVTGKGGSAASNSDRPQDSPESVGRVKA